MTVVKSSKRYSKKKGILVFSLLTFFSHRPPHKTEDFSETLHTTLSSMSLLLDDAIVAGVSKFKCSKENFCALHCYATSIKHLFIILSFHSRELFNNLLAVRSKNNDPTIDQQRGKMHYVDALRRPCYIHFGAD